MHNFFLHNTYKALRGLAPDYLSKLVTIYKPGLSPHSPSLYNLYFLDQELPRMAIDPLRLIAIGYGTNSHRLSNYPKPWILLK